MIRICSVILTLLMAAGAAASDYEINTSARVVAFGDVHGAFKDWTTLLRELGVVDAELNWSGGDTHLVSLGDLIDRSPGSRKVVELLMKLDDQAEQAGGAVHMVLGNHEVMVMTGDLEYVSPAEFAAFAGDENEAERDEGALSDWVENAINERDRLEQEIPFSGFCKKSEQYRLRFVFDILIHNDDRNLTNVLWTKNGFMMMFIDHSLAFRSTEKRPKQYRKVNLEVSDLLRTRLESLNRESLTRELSAYLHPRQIEAILARRDLILKQAEGTSK